MCTFCVYGDKHGRVPLFPCFTVTLTYTRVTFVGRVVLWYFQVGGIFYHVVVSHLKLLVSIVHGRGHKSIRLGNCVTQELQSFL